MYRWLPSAWSSRPKQRPCSAAASWASRPLCLATNASRSTLAWTLPPPSWPSARSSSAWVRSRSVSSRRYSIVT